MIPPAAVTLLLLVTSFKYNGNGAFGESKQARDHKCRNGVDKTFTKFAANFKGNFTRRQENIEELMEKIYVSAHYSKTFE